MRLKRILYTAVGVSAAAVMSGCGVITSADSLMSPPKLTEQQNMIYEALTEAAGKVRLVYPENGSHRSAYIMSDFDGDGMEEAAVFYRKDSDESGIVRLNMIDCTDGTWHSVYDCAGAGASVDSAELISAPDSDRVYIAAGYRLISADDKLMHIYGYKDSVIETVYSGEYDVCTVTDLTNDGADDVLVISGNTDKASAQVSLICDSGEGMGCTDSIPLDKNLTGFEAVTAGYIMKDTPALFIDETDPDGNVSTEIIYCVEDHLRNPAAVEGSTIKADTKRFRGYPCMDIDGDGITEIPVTEILPGYENETEKLYMTDWNVFSDYSIVRKYSGWYSRQGGWCMMFPVRWEGLVTVKKDNATGAVIFCQSLDRDDTELMRICPVKTEQTDAMLKNGWTLIANGGQTDYLVKLSENTSDNMVLTFTEVQNNFFIAG